MSVIAGPRGSARTARDRTHLSPLIRKAASNFAAVAIPVGIAAVVAFQAPVASAAPAASAATAASTHPVAVTSSLSSLSSLSSTRAQAPMLPATSHAKHARHRRHRELRRLRAYAWALSQAGAPYAWGGTGPDYDCSGLVMMAYRHAGIRLPRTTTEMLASPLLVRVWHPKIGDLAFYGSGHVELFRKWGYTFGAHDYGSTVGLIHYGWGWKPTAYYAVL